MIENWKNIEMSSHTGAGPRFDANLGVNLDALYITYSLGVNLDSSFWAIIMRMTSINLDISVSWYQS